MRFAIATVDRYMGVFESFVFAGWKPLKLFTVPARSELGNQQSAIAYAEQQSAAIQLSRVTERDMQELREQGCDALIVASYDWVIGDWRPFLKYAVNFHSSPLPDGRGPYPVVRAIMENRKQWGVTCHRLTPEIDGGEILAMELFPLQADECHEKLDLKIQMAAKKLAARIAEPFARLWEQAKPQGDGQYWKKHGMRERIIDFQKPVAETLHLIRAFGATESLAQINNAWFIVKRAVGWPESHFHAPGSIVHTFNRSLVVAVSDGYIGLLEWSLASPDIVGRIQESLQGRPSPLAAHG